jgi:hypothetical protein
MGPMIVQPQSRRPHRVSGDRLQVAQKAALERLVAPDEDEKVHDSEHRDERDSAEHARD